MAEDLKISQGSKEDRYRTLVPQIVSLMEGESDMIANMANCAAAIMQTFSHLWVGFYIVRGNELVLGPFQGPVACNRIRLGKGVCGQAWEQCGTIIVEDVLQHPGHIACCSLSRSEIVVPVMKGDEVIAVLDIDSCSTGTFDATDKEYLEIICKLFIHN